jgi:hypothetical protein
MESDNNRLIGDVSRSTWSRPQGAHTNWALRLLASSRIASSRQGANEELFVLSRRLVGKCWTGYRAGLAAAERVG